MKKTSGLTIIELMITLLAASILILIISLIMFMAYNSWRFNNALTDIRRDIAMATEMMTDDIRESTSITISGGGFLLETLDNEGTPVTVQYTRAGDTLIRNSSSLADGGQSIIIGKNLVDLTPQTNAMADGIALNLELEDSTFGIGITNQIFINTRN